MQNLFQRYPRATVEKRLIELEIPRFQNPDAESVRILRKLKERHAHLGKEIGEIRYNVFTLGLILIVCVGVASTPFWSRSPSFGNISTINAGATDSTVKTQSVYYRTQSSTTNPRSDQDTTTSDRDRTIDSFVDREAERVWRPMPGGNSKEDAKWLSRDILKAKNWEELDKVIRFHVENGR